jgi:hypothetical protein
VTRFGYVLDQGRFRIYDASFTRLEAPIKSMTTQHTIEGLSKGTGTPERPREVFAEKNGDDVVGSVGEPIVVYEAGGDPTNEA